MDPANAQRFQEPLLYPLSYGGLDGLVELKAPHHDLSTVTTPPADRRKGTVLISCKPNVE